MAKLVTEVEQNKTTIYLYFNGEVFVNSWEKDKHGNCYRKSSELSLSEQVRDQFPWIRSGALDVIDELGFFDQDTEDIIFELTNYYEKD